MIIQQLLLLEVYLNHISMCLHGLEFPSGSIRSLKTCKHFLFHRNRYLDIRKYFSVLEIELSNYIAKTTLQGQEK